jgi:tRNA threonylcarbamoyladenosine biosynthesis protein TsaB
MILAIESAVSGGSLSIVHKGRSLADWNGSSDVSRAEALLRAIDGTLSEAGIDRNAISRIAVSAGPGSFTGIRIGMSTALGLATGLKIPIARVSVLKAMAASAVGEPILAAVPMGRSSVCVQPFLVDNGRILEKRQPETLSESDFSHQIQDWNGQIVVHQSLTTLTSDRDILDAGLDLAFLVGKYCEEHPNESERPLFISKSF